MLKTNQKIKNKFDYFLNILVIILIILFNRINIVYGANINWVEISRTSAGKQYLDKDSIRNQGKGIIEITSKYLKIDVNSSKKIEENIYKMKINCLNKNYKDISVNGKKSLSTKWERTNEDKLIIDLISKSCKNA